MSVLITIAVPVFLVLIVLEAWLGRSRGRSLRLRGYEIRDTAASLAMGLGNVAVAACTKGLMFGAWVVLHEYAIFDIGNAWWAWLILIPAEDFCYYWFHRSHHQVRFLWAAHVNHHSSEKYNLSTALRQSWTTPFTGPVFWLALPLIGFEPTMILTCQAVSLIYQFWLHTEHIDTLGPLEWIMNTPSHHRVHHGRQDQYLDKNHAGIFIVWDRLFGTFEPEVERVDYGLTTQLDTFHPVKIAFHEWRDMTRDALSARSARTAVATFLRGPGWRPPSRRTPRSDG